MPLSEFSAYVAIDWADQHHYWCLADAEGTHRDHGELRNTPEAIDTWVAGLLARFPENPLAVCLEQSRGGLVFQLGKYDRLVVFPVHPATIASFRQAFFPSGAKGDPGDTALLLELLLHHRQHLRRLDPDTPETRLLGMLIELRRRFVDERTRQSNRLTAWLKMYFPQPLDWIDNIDSPLGCDFLDRWPTLQQPACQTGHGRAVFPAAQLASGNPHPGAAGSHPYRRGGRPGHGPAGGGHGGYCRPGGVAEDAQRHHRFARPAD